MTYDGWKCTPPAEPPCVCNAPDCEECEARQAAEDRYWARVDQQIDEAKEREWDR